MILICPARRPWTALLRPGRGWVGLALLAGACWIGSVEVRGGGIDDVRSVLDLEGNPVDPLEAGPAGATMATVFIFVRLDCPISNRYAPEVQSLQARFSSKGVAFKLVYPDPDVTAEEIRRHVKEYGYACPPLRDPAHHLVKRCEARVTPEAAVVTADGELVYHGRIDDRYVALGQWRSEPTRHDLELVLQALVHGR